MRDIRAGGLTPAAALVRAIAAETSLPLRVIVRENAGYGADAAGMIRMCRAAAAFAALPVEGMVIGFARAGQLRLDELHQVLQAAATLPATFHRAFDALDDPLRAIDVLAGVPQIDRILTDGRRAGHTGPPFNQETARIKGPPCNQETARIKGPPCNQETARMKGPPYDHDSRAGLHGPPQRCARLREYSDRAGSRLTIIAGSGVDEEMLGEIARTRCVREVHVGRAARDGSDPEGPVTAARVRRLREILAGVP